MECPSCHREVTPDRFICTWCSKFIPAPEKGEKANFFVRWVALALDPLIAVVLYFLAIMTIGVIFPPLGMAAAVLLPAVYIIWFLRLLRTGRTPGKLLMGLRVVNHQTGELPGFGKMFLREIIGRILSGVFFSLGYWWALFDKNGQAFHDKLAGTVVLKAAPTATAPRAATRSISLEEPAMLGAAPEGTIAQDADDRPSTVPAGPTDAARGPETQEGVQASRSSVPLFLGAGAALVAAALAFLFLRPGTLQVTAQAEAVPSLDGKRNMKSSWTQLASTPAGVLSETKAPAGTYRLRVEGPQMIAWDSTITIHAGRTTRVVIPNLSGTGTWSIRSNVPALVSVDGVARGTTPIDIAGLAVGLHTLRLSAAGYVERNFPPLPVFLNRTSPWNLPLERASAPAQRIADDSAPRPTARPTEPVTRASAEPASVPSQSQRAAPHEEAATANPAPMADVLMGRWYFDRNPAKVRANQIKAEGSYVNFEAVNPDGSLSGAIIQPNNPEVPRMDFRGTVEGNTVSITLVFAKEGITRRWVAEVDPSRMQMSGTIRTISGPGHWTNNWSVSKR